MKSDLDQLIAYYEAQKSVADEQLQECLFLRDYLGAHHYSKELDLIEAELLKLHAFNGHLYQEELLLNKLISNIGYLKSKLKYPKDFWENRIEEKKKDVEQLRKEKAKFFTDSQEIDEIVFALIERKIKSFKLCFKLKPYQEDMIFDFKLVENKLLTISVLVNNALDRYAILNQYKLNYFKKLGFELDGEENILSYQREISNIKDIIFLKTMFARIVYDVFDYDSFDSAFLSISK